jgi:uncharacterized membrane protein
MLNGFDGNMIKNNGKYSFLVLLFLMVSSFSVVAQEEKATVQGSVYNIFLEELDKAVITINTEPKQTIVSKDGTYSFSLNPGPYTIKATYTAEDDIYETKEEIEIKETGIYNIDLILIPSLDADDGDDFIVEETPEKTTSPAIWIVLPIILALLAYFFFAKKKPIEESDLKSETEEQLDSVIQFIKESGGRITQKDIRKKFPSSEAKISLMLTELESKGIIKRIKKGRSNIIILSKEEK